MKKRVASKVQSYRNKKSYQANIKSCLDQIKFDFQLKELQISKFFITHSHFDHISGLEKLIKSYAEKDAEIWFNPYYSFSSTRYNQLLKTIYDKVRKKEIKIVFSHPSNDTLNIKILNNNKYIVRNTPATLAVGSYTIQPNVNDSSILYKIVLGDKSILFPGDIEKNGWDQITSCAPYLSNSTYYCISHHGSMNGHIRTVCPAFPSINNVIPCNTNSILLFCLGRDGAYPGIISPKVISDLNPIRIFRTDEDKSRRKDPAFFRVNWLTDLVDYYW